MEEAAKSLKSRLSCSNICANVCGFDRDYIWIAGFGDVGAELKMNLCDKMKYLCISEIVLCVRK